MKHLRRVLFLILALIITGSKCSTDQNIEKDGVLRRYHSNGKVLAEITFKDGKKHGPYKSWYDNGQLHEESNFENDSIAGKSVTYYKNGKRNSVFNRAPNRKLNGPSFFWYENGVLADSGRYENGSTFEMQSK